MLQNIFLATRDLNKSFLEVDSDLIFEAGLFRAFLAHCNGCGPLTAVSPVVSTGTGCADTPENIVKFIRKPISAVVWRRDHLSLAEHDQKSIYVRTPATQQTFSPVGSIVRMLRSGTADDFTWVWR